MGPQPKKKGHIERGNQTLQDRLMKEMRLAGIKAYERANTLLVEYLLVSNLNSIE